MTRIVVGLGNPGTEYEGTRHNVGFLVLDTLARHEGLLFETARKLKDAGKGDPTLGGQRLYGGPKKFRFARSFDPDALWVKPETFMNLSGTVVGPLARWAGTSPNDILVVYDDLDLDLGVLRLRPHGGAGGQKGMRSIIDSLGTDRFPRLRVGIGRPRTDAARHVLEPFSAKELPEIEISIAEASEAVLYWIRTGDIEQCMTRFHSRWNQGA
ncbi:MAG: aminoacyl-tRNA hydrolase [bacterium]|nr:aminoacyl-tRNA hydrolase [Planctomycetota bacterium]HIL52951.1 aminoacyl-tRNA hydrolase [Planctomycetota bacterium]